MNIFGFVLMTQQQGGKGGAASGLIMMLLIFVVFYFFFIRPQVKKTKNLNKFREALKKGDKVITIGGIHGKILEIRDTNVIIEVENQMRLKVEKSAIAMDGDTGQQQLEQNK